MPKAEIEVKLVTITPDIERHIEWCGRHAYGSRQSDTMEGTRDWIRKRITGYELDVLEHGVMTFEVTGSRVYTHEKVRHRLASYTQGSQRFSERFVRDYIIPPDVDPEDHEEWEADYKAAQAIYDKWRKKYPRQTARYHLPGGIASSLVLTMNVRMLRHVVTMRAGTPALPEMRQIVQGIWAICLREAPSCFEDLEDEMKRRGWL